MVAALPVRRRDEARLFQQVRHDRCARNVPRTVKVHLDELAKAARVVVAQRASVAERLQDRVALQNLGV